MHTSPSRNQSLDLLRIIALMMVILIHLSTIGVKLLPISHPNWYIATFFDALGRPAVHLFILLGGYFLGTRETSPPLALKRTKNLVTPLILFSLLFILTMIHPFTLTQGRTFLQTFLSGKLNFSSPQWYGHLWFLYPYALLMLLTPLINPTLISLPKKQFFQLLLTLFIFFIVLPSINLTSGMRLFYTTAQPLGYFLMSYSTGAYIKRFPPTLRIKTLLFIFASMTLWTWGMSVVQAHLLVPHEIKHFLGTKGAYDNMFANEQLGVFIAAVVLFLLFLKSKPRRTNPSITRSAQAGFHGYVIHMMIIYWILQVIPYKTEVIFSSWYLPITLAIVMSTTLLALIYGDIAVRLHFTLATYYAILRKRKKELL